MATTTWKCVKCGIGNDVRNPANKCSFCGEPRPANVYAREEKEQTYNQDKLKRALHETIEKINHRQRTMTFRWMEDNIL